MRQARFCIGSHWRAIFEGNSDSTGPETIDAKAFSFAQDFYRPAGKLPRKYPGVGTGHRFTVDSHQLIVCLQFHGLRLALRRHDTGDDDVH